MKVLILHNRLTETATQDEMDTFVQVKEVLNSLHGIGIETATLEISFDLISVINKILEIKPNIVFNLVESIDGDGQLLYLSTALLDHMKIPYTGSNTEALFLTTNKLLAKERLEAEGIPTPSWFSLKSRQNCPIKTGVPYIIKSIWEHASIGLLEDSIIIPNEKVSLIKGIAAKEKRSGKRCFAEAYIEGRELNLALLEGENGPLVLPPAEIKFIDYPDGKWKIVDYNAKWNENSFEYLNTERCFEFGQKDSSMIKDVTEIAKKVWEIFGIKGYARVDFRVDDDENPWIIDINANPCLSSDGGFMAAAKMAGLSSKKVIEWIINAVFLNE